MGEERLKGMLLLTSVLFTFDFTFDFTFMWSCFAILHRVRWRYTPVFIRRWYRPLSLRYLAVQQIGGQLRTWEGVEEEVKL